LLIDGTNGGHNTVTGGAGSDTINVSGPDNLIRAGTGADIITIIGTNDTVTSGVAAGANQDQIDFSGSTTALLLDGPNAYSDTVGGFSQADGDRIHLTTDTVADALAHSTQVNGGQDTLITLSDTSTILLKGVSAIDTSFFS
jgi:hypothetical protein